jgi:anti-sigma B factor antagonist
LCGAAIGNDAARRNRWRVRHRNGRRQPMILVSGAALPVMNAVSARIQPREGFQVALEDSGSRTLVTVSGDLDVAVAPDLERVLAEQVRRGVVIVDLRELSFIDASGLGVLVRANTQAHHDGTALQLIPGARVWRLLELCGLRTVFTYTLRPPD